MEATGCNVCNYNDFDVVRFEQFSDFFHQQQEYPVLTCVCRSCGHVFMSPRMTEKELGVFYENQLRESFTAPRGETIGLFDADMKVIQQVLGHGNNRRVLEIGCYTGYMLKYLADHGWKPEGIEPNRQSANRARELFGFPVFEGMVENFTTDDPYELIVMGSVLEHVNNPFKILSAVHTLLKDGGYLFIRVPDVFELNLDTIADVFSIEHPHMFSAITLRRILSRVGFVEIENVKHEKFKRHIISLSQKSSNAVPVIQTNMHDKAAESILQYNNFNAEIRRQARKKIDPLVSDGSRITIYGAGSHTEFLYRYTEIEKCNVSTIVDSNPKKHCQVLLNHTIQPPEYISPDNTDTIIISSRAFQEDIYHQIKGYEKLGIRILKLYDISKSAYRFG